MLSSSLSPSQHTPHGHARARRPQLERLTQSAIGQPPSASLCLNAASMKTAFTSTANLRFPEETCKSFPGGVSEVLPARCKTRVGIAGPHFALCNRRSGIAGTHPARCKTGVGFADAAPARCKTVVGIAGPHFARCKIDLRYPAPKKARCKTGIGKRSHDPEL